MKRYFSFFIVGLLFGCGPETNDTPVPTVLKLNVSSSVGGSSLKKNYYFHLKNGDSILVSRLDFYLENPVAINKQKGEIPIDTILFYSLSKDSNNFSISNFSIINNTIDTLRFLCGLSEFTNSLNPTSYPESHPLSSWNNMYWGAWSKYRYVVLEGTIKKADGSLIQYSFHTGLEYRKVSTLAIASSYYMSSTPVKIKLNIDKIFYPTNGNNINYSGGEHTAHATVDDKDLTLKVAENVSKAFTIE